MGDYGSGSASSLFVRYFDSNQSFLDSVLSSQFEDSVDNDQLSTSVITLINALLQIWIAISQSLPEYTSNTVMYNTCLECLHHSIEIVHDIIVLNNKNILKFKVEFDHSLLVSNFCRYVMQGYPYWTSLKGGKLKYGVEVNRSILKICSLKDFSKTSEVLGHSDDLLDSVSSQIENWYPSSETDLALYKEQLNLGLSFLHHCDPELKKKFAKIICEKCCDEKLSTKARVVLYVFMNTSFSVFEEEIRSLFLKQMLDLSGSGEMLLELCCNFIGSNIDQSVHELISKLLFDTFMKEARPNTTFDTSKLLRCMSCFGIKIPGSSTPLITVILWAAQGTSIDIQERLILLESFLRSELETIWFLKLLICLVFVQENDSQLDKWLKSTIRDTWYKLKLCRFDLVNLRRSLLDMRKRFPFICSKPLSLFVETFI